MIDEILTGISFFTMIIAFCFIPFAPLLMWVVADDIGALDDEKEGVDHE